MIEQVRRTIKQNEMLHKGDTVVVGVSGGADSVALLHFLNSGLPELRLKLAVCHVNHQLRGAESDRDMRFVQTLCAELSVPCHVLSCDVRALAREQRLGEEECGRALRYRFFHETAAKYGETAKIATAHTLSDNAETLLFRLARGTGLKGLCGIPLVRGRIIRPFLEITREQVEDYCAANGLQYVTDSTNTSDEYARNRVRKYILPQLKMLNPSAEQSLARTLAALRADEEYLTQTAVRALCDADTDGGYNVQALAAQPPAIRDRALMLACRENGVAAEREKIEGLCQIILAKYGKISMAAGLWAEVRKDVLCFSGDQAPFPFFKLPFRTGLLTLPSGVAYNITIVPHTELVEIVNKNFSFAILDYDKIKGKLMFRQRRGGDALSLPQRGVTKTLKKLFNEAGVPLEQRGRLAVLCDEVGPVWVEGFGVDKRVQCSGSTIRCLVLRRNDCLKGNRQ